MPTVEKAKLFRLSNDRNDAELEEIPVQFNPESLKLTLSNSTEGGSSRARPARQYMGTAATELAFDLVFDTADEAAPDGGPVNVRDRTRRVEQFVLATGSGGRRQSPPRVKFQWGGLEVKGVIGSLAVDFDLFAPNGFPLRAKMAVTIREQDAEHELLQSGTGASTEGGAADPLDPPPAAPGSAGSGGENAAPALEGESAADFAARMGLDPAAWRGLAAGLENALSLTAGVEIGFSASLGVSAGIGLSAGFEAGVGVSLEARLGLEASASATASASAGGGAGAGFALSAAGGVDAAVQAAAIARTGAAAGAAAAAFSGGAAGAAPVVPASSASASATAVAAAGAATAGAATAAASGARTGSAAAAPALPAPRVDPRAATFGFGVPLRPARGPAGGTSAPTALSPYGRPAAPPTGSDPSLAPWVRLPAPPARVPGGAGAPAAPAAAPTRHRAGCGCGCAGSGR